MNYDAPQPSFELPAPVPDAGESAAGGHEQAAARPEIAPQPIARPVPAQPLAPVPAQPLPQAAPINPLASNQASQAAPPVADDNDLIEEEWISKAKQIVAATREDPHKQSRELSKFKADYLKKRYDKDLKLEES